MPVPIMSKMRTKLTRADYVFLAQLAEEAERYEDVVQQIRNIIAAYNAKLGIEERNLLSVAYKSITNNLRNSWRITDTLEKSGSSRLAETPRQLSLLRRQRERIEGELLDVCNNIVNLLDKYLIPAATVGEESVFYLKMKGDYYRYLVDFRYTQEKAQFAELSLEAYRLAYHQAMKTLDPTHPTRLGLALNFAVYYHDVRNSPERACHLAKNAFDDAVKSLEEQVDLPPTTRYSLTILALLRDDLILWSGEM